MILREADSKSSGFFHSFADPSSPSQLDDLRCTREFGKKIVGNAVLSRADSSNSAPDELTVAPDASGHLSKLSAVSSKVPDGRLVSKPMLCTQSRFAHKKFCEKSKIAEALNLITAEN